MNLKASKKIKKLNLDQKQIIKPDNCSNIKGGGYWCCVRNKWVS